MIHHRHGVGDQPEAIADVADAQDHGRTGDGVEDQPYRVLAIADAERVDLASGAARAAMVGQTSSMCEPRIRGVPDRS